MEVLALLVFGAFIAWLWYEQQPDVSKERKEARWQKIKDEEGWTDEID